MNIFSLANQKKKKKKNCKGESGFTISRNQGEDRYNCSPVLKS